MVLSNPQWSPFAVPSKPGGLQRSGVLTLKNIFHLYTYKIIIKFGSKVSPGGAATSLPSHRAQSGAAAPAAPGQRGGIAPLNTAGRTGDRRGHGHGGSARTRGTVPRRAWEHSWAAWGSLHNFISNTLCRCFLRGCRSWFGKTAPAYCWALPGGSVCRRRVEVSLSLSLHSHGGGAFFPISYSGSA